jgi:aldehyde:ferredoxin oxidoreductase
MPNWFSGEYLDKHHKVKVIACAQCPIACEQMSMVKTGLFAGAMTGIEYESLFANSSNWASQTCEPPSS